MERDFVVWTLFYFILFVHPSYPTQFVCVYKERKKERKKKKSQIARERIGPWK